MACFEVGFGGHNGHVAVQAVGDEGFLAVDDVIRAVFFGGGAQGRQITACARLRHVNGGDHLAAHTSGQPFLFLFG